MGLDVPIQVLGLLMFGSLGIALAIGVPMAFAVAPQAASLRQRPTCAQAVPSALR